MAEAGRVAASCAVFLGEALGDYHFGEDHPFGPQRYDAFRAEFERRDLARTARILEPAMASHADLALFHDADYLAFVAERSRAGEGYLDAGDTPARPGIFDAAARVVGTTLAAVDAVMDGICRRAFTPIAGLHHARRDAAAGFCVFNDCGVAIEALRRRHGIARVLYVDIDAHHGDGVFYSFEDDAQLAIVDFHEDGRFLYPGTGRGGETGLGAAVGTKLNVPLPPDAGDALALPLWEKCEEFIRRMAPAFILLQCGADSVAGDPITHLRLSADFHGHVARRLARLADELCDGRVVAMGGGGYNLANLALAWNNVIEGLCGGDIS